MLIAIAPPRVGDVPSPAGRRRTSSCCSSARARRRAVSGVRREGPLSRKRGAGRDLHFGLRATGAFISLGRRRAERRCPKSAGAAQLAPSFLGRGCRYRCPRRGAACRPRADDSGLEPKDLGGRSRRPLRQFLRADRHESPQRRRTQRYCLAGRERCRYASCRRSAAC